MRRLLIAGGGITGLAAAWFAEQDYRLSEIVLAERDPALGGKIHTESLAFDAAPGSPFLMESGPESLLSRKHDIVGFCESLGIADRLIGTTPRRNRSFVSLEGKLYPVPQGFTGLVPGNPEAILSSDLLSDEAKVRFLREPTVPPNRMGTDESLAAFMKRRFGSEIFERLIEPLAAGIYAGNPELLSMSATFPHLQAREKNHGTILEIDGDRADGTPGSEQPDGKAPQRKRADGSAYPPFVSFPNGMSELVGALSGALKRTVVETGTRLASIQRHDGSEDPRYTVEFDDEHYGEFDAIIMTIPSYEAAGLVSGLDAVVGDTLRQIKYGSTVVVHLAFREEDTTELPDGYGYVVPSVDADLFLACTWTSSKWAGRTPAGYSLVRLFAGRYGDDTAIRLSDEELVARARAELEKTTRVKAEPVLTQVYRWEKAMPQYNLGHRERLAKIRERESGLPGIFFAGAAYDGVGIPDCVRSARVAVRRAAEYLR